MGAIITPHFVDKETEVSRDQVDGPRFHSKYYTGTPAQVCLTPKVNLKNLKNNKQTKNLQNPEKKKKKNEGWERKAQDKDKKTKSYREMAT